MQAALRQALSLSLRPVLRVEGGGPAPLRDLADDGTVRRSFHRLGATLRAYVGALVAGAVPPGREGEVVVMLGNEVNICTEVRASGPLPKCRGVFRVGRGTHLPSPPPAASPLPSLVSVRRRAGRVGQCH